MKIGWGSGALTMFLFFFFFFGLLADYLLPCQGAQGYSTRCTRPAFEKIIGERHISGQDATDRKQRACGRVLPW